MAAARDVRRRIEDRREEALEDRVLAPGSERVAAIPGAVARLHVLQAFGHVPILARKARRPHERRIAAPRLCPHTCRRIEFFGRVARLEAADSGQVESMTEMDEVHEAGEGEDRERQQPRDEADRRAVQRPSGGPAA